MSIARLYIPITIVSLVLLTYSFFILNENNNTPSTNFSIEFDTVIHNEYNRTLSLTEFKKLKINFSEHPPARFLLLFISGSDECSNCLNEISDYISLANKNELLINNYTSLLLFHGVDERLSRRFINISGTSNIIDNLVFTKTSNLPEFDYGNLIAQYGTQNLLYLLDLKTKIMFHGFILPAGNTTKWDVKEIAFHNAIITYTQK